MDNAIAKLILENQALMMRSLSAILHAPGVTATDYRGNAESKLNLHQQLRIREQFTEVKVLELEVAEFGP